MYMESHCAIESYATLKSSCNYSISRFVWLIPLWILIYSNYLVSFGFIFLSLLIIHELLDLQITLLPVVLEIRIAALFRQKQVLLLRFVALNLSIVTSKNGSMGPSMN